MIEIAESIAGLSEVTRRAQAKDHEGVVVRTW